MKGQLGTTLLPTPRTTDANGAGLHGSGGLDLRTVVKYLPTPVASMSSGQPDNGHQSGKSLIAMGSHGAFTVQPSDGKSASSGA